jgi:hypothetical protein
MGEIRISAGWRRAAGAASIALGVPIIFAGESVHAGEIGHFAAGLVNIRDYVMPADPGIYTSIYNYYYTTDRLNDSDGHKIDSVTLKPGPGPGLKIDTNVDVDVFVTVPSLLWVSPWKVLGARYAAYIAPSFANSSVGASFATETDRGIDPDTSSEGLGDLYVQPVWLDWACPTGTSHLATASTRRLVATALTRSASR